MTYQVKNRFQSSPFKCNLQCYNAHVCKGDALAAMGRGEEARGAW
jgi:hypothetical protein